MAMIRPSVVRSAAGPDGGDGVDSPPNPVPRIQVLIAFHARVGRSPEEDDEEREEGRISDSLKG